LLFSFSAGWLRPRERGGVLAGFMRAANVVSCRSNIAFVEDMYYSSQDNELQVIMALNYVFMKVIQFKNAQN
jgi:hypothetical protein